MQKYFFMQDFEQLVIFLCSGAAKAGDKKLSFRIASRLTLMGIGKIGALQDLSLQHTLGEQQQRMIFINDCRSGCVNVLTNGFDQAKYLLFDVSTFLNDSNFDIIQYVENKIIPALNDKWSYPLSIASQPG